MIHNLPNEVLRLITEELNFSDKLSLCKTCHILYEQISKTNLFETLRLRTNAEDIIRMFQDKILDGTQVQTLDLVMDKLSDEIYSNLADIFPNITIFITNGFDHGVYAEEWKQREEHIIKPLFRWKYQIKKYNAIDHWMHFRDELFRSKFPRLVDLNLFSSYMFPGRKEGFDPIFLSNGIRNAPMLTRLVLQRCDISIDSLEEIHNGCPYLRWIEFGEAMVVVDINALPSSIVPANSVLCLKVTATCFDKYGLFLDYIIRKYPKLQDVDINIFNENIPKIKRGLVCYYHEYNRDYDSVDLPEGLKEHNQICEKRLDELEPTINAYRNNGPSFLSQLPISIKSLKLQ